MKFVINMQIMRMCSKEYNILRDIDQNTTSMLRRYSTCANCQIHERTMI